MESPEHENYYDNKLHMFEELKVEVPDKEVPHSDCNVKNEIVSQDMECSKYIDQNEIKHEAMENGLPLNVIIKTEAIVEEEILDSKKNMSVPYMLTLQDVQLNSDERLFKNNVNLLKPKNEQTNMPRLAELNELHKCKQCNIYFDHHDNMLTHISLVHKEKTFKCEVCGKELNSVSNLKRHITISHKHKEAPKGVKIIFKCLNCNTEFNNPLTLNDHAKLCQKEEGIISYKCDSCHGVYKSKLSLRKHVKRMHTNKEQECKCKFCGAVFKMKHNLTVHMKSIHYDYGHTFDCWCGKQFRSPLYLRRHKRLQHERKIEDADNGRFECDSCQKIFKKKQFLVSHIKRVHYEYGRTFDCWCGKQFRSPVHLNDHKQLQHERKIRNRVQCDSCQRFFQNKQSLVTHINRAHYDCGGTFDCWCGKQFRSPELLYVHKLRWHERKIKVADNDRVTCDSCQKFFKNKQSLVIHTMRVHYDYGRTFDCWCGKQFRAPLHLYHHRRRQHERKIKDTL